MTVGELVSCGPHATGRGNKNKTRHLESGYWRPSRPHIGLPSTKQDNCDNQYILHIRVHEVRQWKHWAVSHGPAPGTCAKQIAAASLDSLPDSLLATATHILYCYWVKVCEKQVRVQDYWARPESGPYLVQMLACWPSGPSFGKGKKNPPSFKLFARCGGNAPLKMHGAGAQRPIRPRALIINRQINKQTNYQEVHLKIILRSAVE